MRILQLLASLAIVMALIGCDQNNGQQQHNPHEQQTPDSGSSVAESLSAERTIQSIQILLTLDCVSTSNLTLSPGAFPAIDSAINLTTGDGRQIRFESDTSNKPGLVALANGEYALTVTFTPVNAADLVGEPISYLNSMSNLSIQFQDMLANGLHLKIVDASSAKIAVVINNITATETTLPMPPEPEADSIVLDVSGVFAGIEQGYRSAGGS